MPAWRRAILLFVALSMAACGTAPIRSSSSTYTVRRGDTMYSIATRQGVSVEALARINHIGRDYLIYPGQVLRLPGRAGAVASAPRRSPPTAPVIPPTTLHFILPTQGNYVATTRPNGGQGLMFPGHLGQVIVAAAAGRVVYSGTGLLGYGQLLIIKHDESFLSAYGHLQTVVVHEGDYVKAGQSIATMGNAANGTPQLYFEIRFNGQPVNAAPLLH